MPGTVLWILQMEPHLIYIINEISIFSCLQMKEIEVN